MQNLGVELELDPELARQRKSERTDKLFRLLIPRLRVFGFVAMFALVWAHEWATAPHDRESLGMLGGLIGLYIVISWAVGRLLWKRTAVDALGRVFLILDLPLVFYAVYATGGPESLLFWLPIVRIADQTFMGVRWCLAFTHTIVLGFIGQLVASHLFGGAPLSMSIASFQVGTIYVVGLYISFTAFMSERARHRTSRAVDVARELIAKLYTQSQELEHSRARAEQASRAKGLFLANMSHEIRTPMNAVLGMTELLLQTELTRTQRDYLCVVQRSGDSLLNILNDVLDFSKLEAGKMSTERIAFDPRSVVQDVARSLAPLAHAKELELFGEIASDVPAQAMGDPGRLRQVLMNLAGNAVKFTERGEVRIMLGVERSGGESRLNFCVMDSGVGIPEDQVAGIFEAFTQVENSGDRMLGGTGLGLAISNELVSRMGGVLRVDSQPGRGSRFWFDLAIGDEAAPLVSERHLRKRAEVVLLHGLRPLAAQRWQPLLVPYFREVHATESAADALDLMKRFEGRSFVVVADDEARAGRATLEGLGGGASSTHGNARRGRLLGLRGAAVRHPAGGTIAGPARELGQRPGRTVLRHGSDRAPRR